MRLLLVAEGPHELGDREQAGALEILVRRLMAQPDLEIERRRVSDRSVRAVHTKGRNYEKRALAWLRRARQEGFDALVLLIDQDGEVDRLRGIESAQGNQSIPGSRALGVAVRTFDAWMLADERALTAALGHPIARQRDPETTKVPKAHCIALRDQAGVEIGLPELYAAVADVVELNTLADRCPRGFAPFAERTRRLVADWVDDGLDAR